MSSHYCVVGFLNCMFGITVLHFTSIKYNICIKNITIDVAVGIIRLGTKNILKSNDCEFD